MNQEIGENSVVERPFPESMHFIDINYSGDQVMN